ncbi:hypothetical protein [Bradyrhizobium japonicum]|uniref:hypothetical protein n=1 Tax=Bradyrhizobium japonicum TaxID=375 RepID=UPI0013649D3D|nr:hypothetical protein [Bradyrhizobium japonicum]
MTPTDAVGARPTLKSDDQSLCEDLEGIEDTAEKGRANKIVRPRGRQSTKKTIIQKT